MTLAATDLAPTRLHPRRSSPFRNTAAAASFALAIALALAMSSTTRASSRHRNPLFPAAAAAYSHSLDCTPRISAFWTLVDHRLVSSPPIGPPRSGHVAFLASTARTAIPHVFGGYCEETDEEVEGGVTRYASNDLWRWRGGVNEGDEDDDRVVAESADGRASKMGGWERVDQRGDVPGPRLAAAAAVIGGRPYIFGGWDPQTPGTGGVILDTVHVLDTSTYTWTRLPTTIPGGPTSRHIALALPKRDTTTTNAATATATEAIVHNHRCLDHVLVFDSSTGRFRKQPTTGTAPSPRGLHCAAMCGERYAVVFGGAAQDGSMSNEAFVLDTYTWRWTEIHIVGDGSGDRGGNDGGGGVGRQDRPTPRAASCMCSLTSNCALVFGGAERAVGLGLKGRADLWALHFDPTRGEGRWELILSDDDNEDDSIRPPPRNAATITELGRGVSASTTATESGDVVGDSKSFVLQGGWAPFQTTWSATYVLNVRIK